MRGNRGVRRGKRSQKRKRAPWSRKVSQAMRVSRR